MWQVLNGLDSKCTEGVAVEGGRQSQLFVAQLFISFNWRPMRKQFVGPSSMCGAQAAHVACGMQQASKHQHVATWAGMRQQATVARRAPPSAVTKLLARCFSACLTLHVASCSSLLLQLSLTSCMQRLCSLKFCRCCYKFVCFRWAEEGETEEGRWAAWERERRICI